MAGSSRRSFPSSASRASSWLVKRAWIVRWQIGWTGTVSRPPRLFGSGWCHSTRTPSNRPQSQQVVGFSGPGAARIGYSEFNQRDWLTLWSSHLAGGPIERTHPLGRPT